MKAVWERSTSGGTDLLVLLASADYVGDSGVAWPSIWTLAERCRTSERNLNLCLARLKSRGELATDQNAGKHGVNLYRLTIPALEGVKPASPEPLLNRKRTPRGEAPPCSLAAKVKGERAADQPKTFSVWVAGQHEQGLICIEPHDAAFAFSDDAGLPDEAVYVHWHAFKAR